MISVRTPQLMKQITNTLIEDATDSSGAVVGLALTLAGTKLLVVILEWVGHRVSFFIATQTEDSWRYSGLQCCLSLPLAFLDQTDSASNASKIERAGSNVWVLLSIIIGNEIFIKLFTFISVISTALYTAPDAWFIFIGPLPFYIYLSRKISARISAYQEELNLMTEAASTTIQDALSNCRHVKTFGREHYETLRYAARWGTFHDHEYRLFQIQFVQVAFQNAVRIGLHLGLVLWCYQRIKAGVMSVGDMTMLTSYLDMTMSPVDSLSSLYPRAVRHVQRVKPLVELFRKQDPLRDDDHAKALAPLESFIELKDVHFAYTSQVTLGKVAHSIPALRGTSFSLPRGQTTAIVGPSGAGKTTLTALLLRFYDPDSGQILWDGVPLSKATRTSLRRQVTLVPQDTSLFNRSAKDNIAYGWPEAALDDVITAAKRAMAHDFIVKLPMGYDTIVGERGVRLSGGQKQRIAIARALLLRPSLLILDESTSHLDTESEAYIQQALRELQGTVTKLVIAHRLSTVLSADQIVVMDDGRVLACGKHAELLETCSLYQRLYALQFKDEKPQHTE